MTIDPLTNFAIQWQVSHFFKQVRGIRESLLASRQASCKIVGIRVGTFGTKHFSKRFSTLHQLLLDRLVHFHWVRHCQLHLYQKAEDRILRLVDTTTKLFRPFDWIFVLRTKWIKFVAAVTHSERFVDLLGEFNQLFWRKSRHQHHRTARGISISIYSKAR